MKPVKFAIFCCFLMVLYGCAALKEDLKGIAGVSTKILEDSRKDAAVKTFNSDYFTCYTKSLDLLKSMDYYIYAKDLKKHMIAVYVSAQDTTPVGVFFDEIEKNKTKVEISSPSKYAKELTANKIFAALEKSISVEKDLQKVIEKSAVP